MKSRSISAALRRLGVSVLSLTAVVLAGCSSLLEVQFPGRIPTEQIDDPSLAPVLARSVISDFECAYSNYTAGSSAHSDEWETSNSNVPLANWGERSISRDEDNYVIHRCEDAGFGMNLTIHTARFQSEDVYNRLTAWTDAEVPGRGLLMATVRAFGGYAYVLLGEGFCEVAFDGGSAEEPSAALAIAEERFTEAISLAEAASNVDIATMARIGLARAKLDLGKYAEAAALAAQVPVGYVKNADRGSEHPRRWNDIFRNMNQLGAYTLALPLRTLNDPRLPALDTGGGAFNPGIRLWVSTKYTGLNSPIRLASGKEAMLILAEAQAAQNLVAEAQTTINAYRALYPTLTPLTFSSQADAIAKIIEERRFELALEGGHRLNDLLRHDLPWKGANGSTTTTNPFTARPYGATTCWPLPTKEASGA